MYPFYWAIQNLCFNTLNSIAGKHQVLCKRNWTEFQNRPVLSQINVILPWYAILATSIPAYSGLVALKPLISVAIQLRLTSFDQSYNRIRISIIYIFFIKYWEKIHLMWFYHVESGTSFSLKGRIWVRVNSRVGSGSDYSPTHIVKWQATIVPGKLLQTMGTEREMLSGKNRTRIKCPYQRKCWVIGRESKK